MSLRPADRATMLRMIALLPLIAACLLVSPRASSQDLPYLVDSLGAPTRSADDLCWRTGFWSPAAAAAAQGEGLPPGCACEPGLIPAGACTPAAVPRPASEPAPAEPLPAPPSSPAPAGVITPQRVKLSAEAHFKFNQSVLDGETLARLEELSSALAQVQLEVILVVGHADRIGPESYNQRISEKRAAAIKQFLIGKGVAASRIYTEGKGEMQPRHVGDCNSPGAEDRRNTELIDCLQADRRVEIEAIGVR